MAKPSIPQGMRDFDARVVQRRRYILDTIRNTFLLYGFQPLETPAMENLETLTGKYGEEGDKLIFKVLNNGLNDPKNEDKAKTGFDSLLQGKSSSLLTERALKYDLTIPFARYVAMNAGKITFPYKRYQMQPVWRADRPQKGRYREFTQCDADIVGSESLWYEVEFAHIYNDVFKSLNVPDYKLQINNRKLLSALAEKTQTTDQLTAITVIIDKMDKIGLEKVITAFIEIGLNEETIKDILFYLNIEGTNQEKLIALKSFFSASQLGNEGIDELEFITRSCKDINLTIDLTLARGLNYYTGTIYEVKAPASVTIGSIGGGGRYDDLTGLFGVPDIPGVGISFGVDRIYDVLEALNKFPDDIDTGADAIFFNMGEEEMVIVYPLINKLRQEGISCELIGEPSKLDKQFKYAEKKNIPLVVIIGKDELDKKVANVKQLSSGNQVTVPFDELTKTIKELQSIH